MKTVLTSEEIAEIKESWVKNCKVAINSISDEDMDRIIAGEISKKITLFWD